MAGAAGVGENASRIGDEDGGRDGTPAVRSGPADLTVEADELWSLVGGKGRVRWVRASLDLDTRQVVAMVAGDGSEGTARQLWVALPAAYRDRAVVCTDF